MGSRKDKEAAAPPGLLLKAQAKRGSAARLAATRHRARTGQQDGGAARPRATRRASRGPLPARGRAGPEVQQQLHPE